MASPSLLDLQWNILAVPCRLSENGVIWGSQCLPHSQGPDSTWALCPQGQTDGLRSSGVGSALVLQCRPGGLTAGWRGVGGQPKGGRGTGSWGRRSIERGAMALHIPSLGPPHISPVLWGLPGPETGKRHKSGVPARRVSSLKPTWEPRRAQTRLRDLPLPRGLRAPLAGSRAPGREGPSRLYRICEISGMFF